MQKTYIYIQYIYIYQCTSHFSSGTIWPAFSVPGPDCAGNVGSIFKTAMEAKAAKVQEKLIKGELKTKQGHLHTLRRAAETRCY